MATQRLSTILNFGGRTPVSYTILGLQADIWARVPVLTDIFRSYRNLPQLSDRREKC